MAPAEALATTTYLSALVPGLLIPGTMGISPLGKAGWRNIMDYVMAQTGRRLTNAAISRDLKNLVKIGFIERQGDEYRIIDPMVRYAMLGEY